MPTGVYIRTEEHKKHQSNAMRGKPSGMKNKHHSNETKKNMSLNRCGVKHPRYGKRHTKETKEKISKSHWKGGRKLSTARQTAVRKQFGFIPLNSCDQDGWVGHHIDFNYVIFIPEELHKSVWHSVIKNINMNLINDKVYEWFMEYYFGGL